MFLKQIATKAMTESFEAWDSTTQSFIPDAFLGRISISDRFLSNFNKPLRRRMLFTDPSSEVPNSGVFRHPGTQDVYLLGQSRSDANATGGDPYVRLSVCHLVTDTLSSYSGRCEVVRMAPAGPEDNPGWLEEVVAFSTYMDMEFRTSSPDEGEEGGRIENYTATLPSGTALKEWDYLKIHGQEFQVVDVFPDSGLTCCRVDESPKRPWINCKFHVEQSVFYDRHTHTHTKPASEPFNVTARLDGSFDFSLWLSESEEYIDLLIDEDHIGFRPSPGQTTVEWEGRVRNIASVTFRDTERQYVVRCR